MANPTTIWDFNGSFGLIDADGVSQHNSEDRARRWACDVRFMTGVFRDRWTGTGERLKINNDMAGFGGLYEHASATVEWSASNSEGYFFSTINSSQTNVTDAFTAHVRNGTFFPS